MPTMNVSSTRNATMYSLTRAVIEIQLATTQMGVRKVDNSTKNSEMPSMPRW